MSSVTVETGPCLYCDQSSPAVDFEGREHVIPQSFGTFEPVNLIADAVCDQCNRVLGKELDEPHAHGTLGGALRHRAGLRDYAKFKPAGARTKWSAEILSPAFAWVPLHARPAPTDLGFSFAPAAGHISFGVTTEGPWETFPLTCLPPCSDWIARYGQPPAKYATPGPIDEATVRATLRSAGYDDLADKAMHSFDVPPDAQLRVRVVHTVDAVVKRAIAKIAFNYLSVVARDIARSSPLDPIRRHIRYGDKLYAVRPTTVVTLPADAPMPEPVGHLVGVAYVPNRGLRALVALFGMVWYELRLAAIAPADHPDRAFSIASLFDLKTKRISAVPHETFMELVEREARSDGPVSVQLASRQT